MGNTRLQECEAIAHRLGTRKQGWENSVGFSFFPFYSVPSSILGGAAVGLPGKALTDIPRRCASLMLWVLVLGGWTSQGTEHHGPVSIQKEFGISLGMLCESVE
jgi:hypothetical protein